MKNFDFFFWDDALGNRITSSPIYSLVKFVAANNYVVGRKYFFDDGLINDIDSIEILNN